MSGIELIAVLGVAASAAQLIDYSLRVIGTISEIYSRVEDAPKRVVRYTAQINQIIAASKAIEEYQDLHTLLVDTQLQNTLAEIKHLHKALGAIHRDYTTGSSRKRVWKAIVGSNEKRILTSFERLEKEKTALILCITVNHTKKLQTIGAGVEILVEREMAGMPNVRSIIDKINGKAEKETTQKESTTNTKMSPENQIAERPTSSSLVLRAPLGPDSVAKIPNLYQPPPTEPSGHSYTDQKSKGRGTQFNGDVGAVRDTNNSYVGSTSTDKSLQVNGNHKSSGIHEHKRGCATGDSVQVNGNVGPGVTKAELKEWME
ncbi:uncharacterized protein PAC_18374 [Phialocephala subalpina]|uniref:Fungal N-terminal domain-containing protein n=1 Tax=Phialocephala subalpina TaxID=576137 RepID=A0A1L7XU01_9HELO|nr:uncharacterized protein PAC_18374 [Phialocephala subalpina]